MAATVVSCPKCGVKLKLASEPTPGKKLRCPKCEHVFVPAIKAIAVQSRAPATVRDLDDEPLPQRKGARRRHEDDDEDRPREKKQSSRKGLIIGLAVGGGVAVVALVVVLILVLGGRSSDPNLDPGKGPVGGGGAVAGDAPRDHELAQFMQTIVTHIQNNNRVAAAQAVEGLILPNPDAWFRQTFGEALGGPAANLYAQQREKFRQGFLLDLENVVRKGRTKAQAVRVDDPADPKATGNMKRALEKMKERTPLYLVRLVEPGKTLGTSYHSFVWADRGFRFVGRMETIK